MYEAAAGSQINNSVDISHSSQLDGSSNSNGGSKHGTAAAA